MPDISINSPAADLKAAYTDRGNYFFMCVGVSRARGTPDEKNATEFLRRVMVALGYPAEVATWDADRLLMYADNIVMMG
jgi:hypothetical protein